MCKASGMANRREIEQFILIGLREIQELENRLNGRFGALATMGPRARTAFVSSLQELENRTATLERLMDALDRNQNTALAVA
jgi:hypothetical protein